MKIYIIAAMAKNRVIGKDNKLLWNLPADMARFKKLTMGRIVIMGRKTYESIGKPLEGRINIVVTKSRNYQVPGCLVTYSLDEALTWYPGCDAYVIGGAEIYEQVLPRADMIFLTVIDREYDGDAYFPEIDFVHWRETEREEREDNGLVYSFITYQREKTAKSR